MSENINTSEQYQSLTSSQNGKNVMPLLQPKSHFFLEDENFTQEEQNRFGAISENEFRTTATVSFDGTKEVFAICQGSVFVQPNTGDDTKVNLVLRPFRQPITNVPIKYIIYRGLQKSDFFTQDGKITGDENTGSGFVKYIWSDFKEFYKPKDDNNTDDDTVEEPEFLANFIGYPNTAEQLEAQEPTDRIDQYFFKLAQIQEETGEEKSNTAYELPLVPRGIHLGTAQGSLGIDIVLDTGDYYIKNDPNPFQLNLEYVRAASYTLNISTITDTYQKKLLKENSTRFMDVAAFYGMHTNGIGKLYLGNTNIPITSIADIYEKLQGFATKNKTYIYIQANRQRSYDFYGNYKVSTENQNNYKIGNNIENLSETSFGTLGWPIHEFTATEGNDDGDTTIAIQITTDNHQDASLYIQTGQLLSWHEENFVRGNNLLAIDTETSTSYTKPLLFKLQNTSDNVVSSFIQLICKTRQMTVSEFVGEDAPDTESQNFILKDIDDMFGLLQEEIVNIPTTTQELPTIVDERLQIVNFINLKKSTDVAIVKHQKVIDRIPTKDQNTFINRVTYETLLEDIKQNISPTELNSATNSDSSKTGLKTFGEQHNQFYLPKLPYYIEKQQFTHNSTIITGLRLKNTLDTIPTKKILGFTEKEFQRIRETAVANNLNNCKIFFKNQLYNETDYFYSLENTRYKQYHIAIVGEDQSGKLKLHTMDLPIIVFSLDNSVYISKEYPEIYKPSERDFYKTLKLA